MKPYDFAAAPNPRRVRMFIAEKGIEVPTVQVDLSEREQAGPEFTKINPWQMVPALELDDGTVICECVAICRYLEDTHPEPPLIGSNPRETALVEMWQHRCEVEGLTGGQEAFRNSVERLKGRALPGPFDVEQIPALAERGRGRVERFFVELDERLADNEFVAGENFSIADITAFITVENVARVKLGLTPEQINAKRCYDAMKSRPSAEA
jgi:glutathione S-transferase